MKKFRELSGQIKEKDEREYDYEGDMAKTQLKTIIRNAETIHDMIEDDENLPEWVQSKITLAKDYIVVAANYLQSEMNEEKETGFQKTFRKNTGETYDQYANRRAKEEDERQEKMKKQKEDYIKQGIIKAESVELDEALRHEIAGQVGRFIGNKIDPVHGDIMHAHGKEAYRQAAYHIRKTVNDVKDAVSSLHDRLHKQLRTGGLTTEDVEIDEARYPGFRPGLGLGKRGAPSQRDNYKDFNDGRPLGFTPIKDKKPEEPKKMKEEAELLDEKNEPTNPELWSRAKALAKSKFDVYPSAYANGWASKWYKSKGGGWKSVSEETELDEGYFKKQETERQETKRLAKKNDLPFTPDKPKKRSVVVGKKPEGYSRARQLARQAMQKYINPVKESLEESRKTQIVREIVKKKKKENDDKFNADPVLSSSVTKNT